PAQIAREIDGDAGRRAKEAKGLGSSVYQLVGIAGNQKVIVNELQSLSSALVQSSASIEEITRTAGSFSRMAASNSSIASITDGEWAKAESLATLTEEGEARMRSTFEGISEIERDTESIHDVIEVIDEIASRTNLLAMNAAIEAAHAGEAGKSFGVVADEIRKLAESTAENSQRVAEELGRMVARIASIGESGKMSLDTFVDIRNDARHGQGRQAARRDRGDRDRRLGRGRGPERARRRATTRRATWASGS
ncbi:MAG: methyl-accepting chemotaxis protein, partial [Spirochaetaceae bacterium]|nr:methyl-accepting chemotaxis protein [Spirochaetaceae bacterium]